MEQVMLDMIPTGAKAVCHVSQYDVGRTIRFNLVSGGTAFSLSGTETIKVYIKKPDGTTAERNIANTSSTYVDWVTGEGDCNQAGKCECELIITSGTTVIGSKNFIMNVEEDPYNDQGVVTETAGPAIIATFTTNVVDTLQEVKCEINAKQDLHGYDHPWPAGGGVNILKPIATDTTVNGVRVVGDDSGKVTVTGTASADTQIEFYSFAVTTPDNYTLILKEDLLGSNNTYWLSMAGVGVITSGHRATNSFTGTGTFKIRLNVKSGSATNFTVYPMVAKGNVDIPYAPYSNVCPINGFTEAHLTRCGVNLCFDAYGNKASENTYLYPSGDNLPINVNNTLRTAYAYVGKNQDVVVSFASAPQRSIAYGLEAYPALGVICHSLNVTALSSTSFKVNSGNYDYIAFYYCNDSGNIPSDCQIEKGTTATSYSPYNGTTVTIAFGQTVYRGVLDVTSGKLSVTWAKDIINDMPLSKGTFEGVDYFIYNQPLKKINNFNIRSDVFSTSEQNYVPNMPDNSILAGSSNTYIYIRADAYATVSALKTALGSNCIVYELDTPFDIDLTPHQIEALLGINNVWHDGNGDTEVKYLYNA